MDENEDVSMSVILYYIREGLFNHAHTFSSSTSHSNHAVPQLMQAICLLLKNESQKSLRMFEGLYNQPDVYLASTAAMIHVHKKARSVEKDTVQFLEGKLKNERKQGNARAFYYAGLFHHVTGRNDKAREYVERAIKMEGREMIEELLSLRGWMEMEDSQTSKAVESFDLSLRNRKLPEALLGKARAVMLFAVANEKPGPSLDGALELINQSVVLYKGFVPGLVEKGRFYMSQLDWEAMYDTCQRITESEANNLQAMEMMVLYHLAVEVDYTQASQYVGHLMTTLSSSEASNHQLYHHYARLFSALSDKDDDLLKQTIVLQDTSIKLCADDDNKSKSSYLSGLGDIYLLKSRHHDALKCFNAAYDADDTNSDALIGRLRCYHATKQTSHFNNQMSFLQELKSVLGDSPKLELMRLIGNDQKRTGAVEKLIAGLKASISGHLERLEGSIYSSKSLVKLELTFLLEAVEFLFRFIPSKPMSKGQNAGAVLQFTSFILHFINKRLPSHLSTNCFLAKCEFFKGDSATSLSLLQHCINHQPSSSSLHLLMAQVYLYDKNFTKAEQSLDAALSHDFKVKEHTQYQLVRVGVLVGEGGGREGGGWEQRGDEAIQILTHALNQASASKKEGASDERFQLYMSLVEVLRRKGDVPEASRVLEAASKEYEERDEFAGELLEARVELCVKQEKVDEAIKMLKSVKPDRDMYVQAQQRMAQIYLKNKCDQAMYITCYKDLYARQASSHNGVTLGDAYMNVQQPDKAIEAYETAMKKNARDYQLAHKIGQALVKTHQYGRAVIYYECALKQKNKDYLRYDLGRLLMLLGQNQKAEKILKNFIEAPHAEEDTDSVAQLARCSHLMGEMKRGSGCLEWFEKAKASQDRVLMRVSVSDPQSLIRHKKFAAKICADLASVHKSQRRLTNAVKYLREAVRLDPEEAQHHLDLVTCLLISSNLAECQQICRQLMQAGMDNGLATLLLCEVLLREDKEEEAIAMIQKMFQERKGNFELLAKAIDIMRRARRLDESQPIIQKLASKTPNHSSDPGYNYCKGLVDWYNGDVRGALGHLNVARGGIGWEEKALRAMVDICTNPDEDTVGGRVFVKEEDSEYLKKKRAGLETAELLLKELKATPHDYDHMLQKNMIVMMMTSQADIINAILNDFLQVLKQDEENVIGLYGSAVAYALTEQTSKSKAVLKKIYKMDWNIQDARHLERGWLLYADIMIQKGSNDTANEILNKCLLYNKSCTKALEYRANIEENGQDFKTASTHYQSAWSLNHNPAIGYKFAFNLLKIKEFTKCIDVCHQVLDTHPSYPKIKKEILEKARSLIKITA